MVLWERSSTPIEATKPRKYEGVAKANNARLIVASFETYGGWGKGSVELMKELKGLYKQEGLSTQQQLYRTRTVMEEVAIAIQRYNAKMLLDSNRLAIGVQI